MAKRRDSKDVTTRLREAITSGRFQPNERLIEMELAALLAANRTNVRTALAQLEQEGLVVREANRGARVRLVSHEDAIEITQARGALEALIAGLAAARAKRADQVRLHDLVNEMRAAVETGDLIAYSKTNGLLHAEIERIAGHRTAGKLLANLNSQVVRFQYRSILLPGRSRRSLAEHEAIVAAICAGDVEAAERSMGVHLRAAAEALREVIEASKTALV
ncbi:MAG: GntR family transcriptional regulator [Hyphomicrobiales bacterium]|nr:GntR family transcriptional regulator [Hyphomicrobiales bacterium]MBV9518011.1 GntR family transcriptional regulator [Hyphomicrobiales bacterium]